MGVKQKIIDWGRKNCYINDAIFHHYKKNRSRQVEKIITSLQREDTIQEQKELSRYRKEIQRGQLPYWAYDINETNYRMYGIGEAVFGKENGRKIWYPAIEHGLILYPRVWSDVRETCRAGVVTFGKFRKEVLQKELHIPVYTVGPYIQYAPDYYDAATRKAYKDRLGKNLLVFLSHSTDKAAVSFEEKKYMDEVLSFRKEFDTITICTFWWNINDSFVEQWKSEGCNIVSAGYREDPFFLSRLKEIILASDMAIGDGVGTNIGYCLSLNKPFKLLELKTKVETTESNKKEQEERLEHEERIRKAFLSDAPFGPEQKKIFEYYWGGGIYRSAQERQCIAAINKKITKKCKGNVSCFGKMDYKKILSKTEMSLIENM